MRFLSDSEKKAYRGIHIRSLQPRANTERMLEDERVPKDVALKAQRLEGAHLVRRKQFESILQAAFSHAFGLEWE